MSSGRTQLLLWLHPHHRRTLVKTFGSTWASPELRVSPVGAVPFIGHQHNEELQRRRRLLVFSQKGPFGDLAG